ncbi:MAG: hypothetical protein F6J89_29560 [Symploca sp. SIO1C4]|uniref:Uncharacterized protein n=1 Tax=Symploca sp. SIO1C4 TaxID=2607765 RepID=A0A6B3NDQ8_9CYAN|nr:hypothetical protein [Symploca sp. SIO1C4]
MTIECVDPKLKWLLQCDWRDKFIPSLGREPWLTVYFDKATEDENLGIFSTLIPNTYVETSLSQTAWDLLVEDWHPVRFVIHNQGSEQEVTYLRFGNSDGIEPFVIHRSFLAEFSEPEQIDLIFKERFIRFSKKWENVMGWSFLRQLAEADDHFFKTLHIPLTNSQPEFDAQILALTKLLIDSLNEKAIVKATPGGNTETKGISKLEHFLKAYQYQNYQEHIKFLRNLQNLRSSSVAHRKGDNYNKIANNLGLKDNNRADVLKKILVEATDFLLSLESHFLNQ